MSLKDDIINDVDVVFMNLEELAEECTWVGSKNSEVVIGLFTDFVLNGDDHSGQVNEASTHLSIDSNILLNFDIKRGEEITVKSVIYIVVNDPIPSPNDDGFSLIPLRRKYETKL